MLFNAFTGNQALNAINCRTYLPAINYQMLLSFLRYTQ